MSASNRGARDAYSQECAGGAGNAGRSGRLPSSPACPRLPPPATRVASVQFCRSDTPPQLAPIDHAATRTPTPGPRRSLLTPIASASASLQGRGQHSSPLTFLSS